jgi:NCS1 family nucleobase:cation symporter-1
MVIETLGEAGAAWAVMGIALVLLSTVTSTFLDIYSTVVSAQNLVPRLPLRPAVAVTGLGGALVATQLDVFSYEPFLLAIGAVFLPIFTVVLTDHLAAGGVEVAQVDARGGSYWYRGGVHVAALVAWLAGFLTYDALGGFRSLGAFVPGLSSALAPVARAVDCGLGSSLPCIVVTGLVYRFLARRRFGP